MFPALSGIPRAIELLSAPLPLEFGGCIGHCGIRFAFSPYSSSKVTVTVYYLPGRSTDCSIVLAS